MKKMIIITVAVAVLFIGGSIVLLRNTTSDAPTVATIVDGTQVIDITAKGGYAPRVITASAKMPTTLRVHTKGTFDCSSSLVIPSIGYRGNLPPSGTTDIPIPAQPSGSTLQGVCGMGMYSFAVRFE